MHGDEALCELLLSYGAAPGTRSDDGRRAADLALEKNHQALAGRLSPDSYT
jgi:ankyrin repeat protein